MELQGKKVLVLGGRTGLLGQSVCRALEDAGAQVQGLGRSDLDIHDHSALSGFIEREEPELVFNCTAYTLVDQAEDEPEEATELNRTLPGILARLACRFNFFLVHYSTDFVFNGRKETPYLEGDPTGPVSIYGSTKLLGEEAVTVACPEQSLIVRTAWLFGPGKTNFVQKILGFAKERDELTVVCDQTGSPTYTPDLAAYTLNLLQADATGLYHAVNSGRASWCELAAEAVSLAGIDCRVTPIPSSNYPTKAVRPANSVLSTEKFTALTGITPRPWPDALRDYIFMDLGDDE